MRGRSLTWLIRGNAHGRQGLGGADEPPGTRPGFLSCEFIESLYENTGTELKWELVIKAINRVERGAELLFEIWFLFDGGGL